MVNPSSSRFQSSPHQPAVVLPGEIGVVDLFGRDPAYPGHVVGRAWLAFHNTGQKADGENPVPTWSVGVRSHQDRSRFDFDLDAELLPHLPLDPLDGVLPDFDETAGHVDPSLLRLSGTHGDEGFAVAHDGNPDRGGRVTVPGPAARGACHAATRARVSEGRAVRGTEAIGLRVGERHIFAGLDHARAFTSSSATPASWSTLLTTSTRSHRGS